jgi:apolipoprotein D and lipocalin family protein
MKKLLTLIILFTSLMGSNLESVSYVSPKKFSGLWYEIARTYNSYQEKCVASSVEYILRDEREYDVLNRCFDTKIGGELIKYKGTAQPTYANANMSVIDMTYFWVFTKTYEVYYLDEDYSSAVVADSNLEQVWIMSRTPKIEEQKLQKILALLQDKMDLKKLIYTPQDEKGRYK